MPVLVRLGGRVVFNAGRTRRSGSDGEKRVILTRIETSPEDIKGMDASRKVFLQVGRMTSHAALVARQIGEGLRGGCSALGIDYVKKEIRVDGKVVKEGDTHIH